MTNLSFLKSYPGKAPVDCGLCMKPTKCCAFQPYIPNFLLGGWIEKMDLTQLPMLRTAHWHPIGLVPASAYRKEHQATNEPGRSLSCSFFGLESRLCSLYEFRPSECRIYYCDEQRLLPERMALLKLSFDEEVAVAQMAMLQMDLTRSEMSAQVEVVNQGSDRDFIGRDLVFMYKQAWKWSQTVSREMLDSWMNP